MKIKKTQEPKTTDVKKNNDKELYAAYKNQVRGVTVPIYQKKNGARNYQKKDHCYYCRQEINSKISKHLLKKHTDRNLVKRVVLSKGEERQKLLYKLQQLGNYQHNVEVIAAGEGELVVARRPTERTSASDFAPCVYCLIFCHKDSLFMHTKKCPLNDDKKSEQCSDNIQDGLLLLQSYLPQSDKLDSIILGMKETKENKGVVDTISSDKLIRLFGHHQLLRKGNKLTFDQVNQIRAKLRFLARLLHTVREVTDTKMELSDLIRPQYYDAFVEAVLKIRETNMQLARTLGHYIKRVCLLNIGEAIKSRNKELRNDSEDFLHLYKSSWGTTVAASTLHLQQTAKLNKTIKLPTTSDLVKVTSFIQTEIGKEMKGFTEHTRLQKLVMASLILFNKRRPAEIAHIKISDYRLSFDNQEDREEILNHLTLEERVIADRMHALEVKGKSTRGIRGVFVLIDQTLKPAIDKLIILRPATAPPSDFLFARPNSVRPYCGTEVLKEVVNWCVDIEHPERINAQKLRKYLATTCQVLDMNGNELRLLAGHMGHNLNIHIDHYAMQSNILERTKVAKVLTAVQNGKLVPQDKNIVELNDVNINDEDIVLNDSSEGHYHTVLESDEENSDSDLEQEHVEEREKMLGKKVKEQERNRWTEQEIQILLNLWTSTDMPTKDEMKVLTKQLPGRDKAKIRAKAQYMLKKRKK